MDCKINNDTIVKAGQANLTCDMIDSIAILNLETDTRHTLNAMGVKIWCLLQEPISVDRIVQTIMGEYEVPRKICEQDIFEVLQKLYQSKIITLVKGTLEP